MSIRFAELPTSLRDPGSYVEINTTVASVGLPATEDTVCLLGQMTSGTADPEELTTIRSADEAGELFGRGSQLHRMAIAAYDSNPNMAALVAVGLEDAASSTAASGAFAITVTTAESGTLRVRVGADWVSVGVAAGDTASAIADAVKDALDEQPDLPIVTTGTSGSGSTYAVEFDARNAGTLGNGIDLDWDFTAAGVSIAVTAMTGGATDPDIQDALDVISESAVTILVSAWSDATNLGDLESHLTTRSDGLHQRGAVGVTAMDTTVSTATTRATGRNYERLSIALLEGTPSWAPEVAAAYAAAIAGESDLALPLNSVVLKGIAPPLEASRFIHSERETLLAAGVTPLGVNGDEEVIIVRSVSTRTRDSDGGAYYYLLDLQVIRVLDYLRIAVKDAMDTRFRQVKLAAVAHTEKTTDVAKIRAVIIDVLKRMEAIDYLQNVDDNLDAVVVQQNETDATRVDGVVPGDVVRGLHVKAFRIDLLG